MRRIGFVVVVTALAAGVYVALPPRARELPAAPAGLAAPVRGAIHVHTRRSDGSGSVDDVAAAAARAGLRFVIITDHGDGTRAPDPPSYRDTVLVIDAVEISTYGGHLVALGLPRAPYPLAGGARDVIEDVERLGGFAIAAHPTNDKAESRWVDWDARIDGLEWLNGDSEWRDESPWRLARMLLVYPMRHVESLGLMLDRNEAVMQQWDALLRRRRVVALAAADAHARVGLPNEPDPSARRSVLRIPGYEAMFRAFSIALPQVTLSGDAQRDADAVVAEIRAGRVFSSVDVIASRPAFTFEATSGTARATAGESLPVSGPVHIGVNLQAPADAQISVIRDGLQVLKASGASLEYDAGAEPAVYRVEVLLPGAPGEPAVPWIVSNPIYAGRPPVEQPMLTERPAATQRLALYTSGAAPDWTVEQGTTAQAALDVVRAVGGGTQLLLRYALSGTQSSSPFAALVVPAGPIAQYDRVTFSAHADRPMRLSVQLRVPRADRPAGDRWHRSIYLDEASREITVFFDEMAPAGQTATPRPVMEDVRSLLFVVDTVNTKPGTAGQVFIGTVRYER